MSKKSCAERLVEHFGNMPTVASVVGDATKHQNSRTKRLGKQAVFVWIRLGYVPEVYALAVERVTGGKITADEVLKEAEKARRRIAEERLAAAE